MAFVVYQAFWVAMAAIAVGLVRCMWGLAIHYQMEKQCAVLRAERDRLEREIVLARLNCAAANPEAATILTAWEAARKNSRSLEDQITYNRFFERCMGGESRATPISREESAIQLLEPRAAASWLATSPEPSPDSCS